MGRDKALLEIGGVPLALRAARLLEPLVADVTLIGDPRRYVALGVRVVPDDEPNLGPLGGIATALRVAATPWNLIVACDLPFLTREWLGFLLERATASQADALLPSSAEGHAEPLCAAYHRRCEPAIRAALARGVRKVTDGLAGLRVAQMPHTEWKQFDSRGRLFKNMNSPADYEEARAILAS